MATASTTRHPSTTATGSGQVVSCQGCGVSLELPGSGNWKCPRCYTFISVDGSGSTSFTNSSGPVPLNLSLTASQDCGEGLVHLVTSVCSQSFNGQKLQDLRVAVHEIAQVMSQSLYPNNPTGGTATKEQLAAWVAFAIPGATDAGADVQEVDER